MPDHLPKIDRSPQQQILVRAGAKEPTAAEGSPPWPEPLVDHPFLHPVAIKKILPDERVVGYQSLSLFAGVGLEDDQPSRPVRERPSQVLAQRKPPPVGSVSRRGRSRPIRRIFHEVEVQNSHLTPWNEPAANADPGPEVLACNFNGAVCRPSPLPVPLVPPHGGSVGLDDSPDTGPTL